MIKADLVVAVSDHDDGRDGFDDVERFQIGGAVGLCLTAQDFDCGRLDEAVAAGCFGWQGKTQGYAVAHLVGGEVGDWDGDGRRWSYGIPGGTAAGEDCRERD